MEYIQKFGLPIQPFINETPEDIFMSMESRPSLKSYQRQPDILRYPVAPQERGKTAQELLNMAIQPILDFINKDPSRNWPLVEKDFDKYSMYTFLKFYPHPFGTAFSEGAIEMIGVLLGTEGYMEQSFLDILRFLDAFASQALLRDYRR